MVETASDVGGPGLDFLALKQTDRQSGREGEGSPSYKPVTVHGSTSKAKHGWAGVRRTDFVRQRKGLPKRKGNSFQKDLCV